MNVTVVELPAIRLAVLKHVGPYHEIGPVFEKLSQWAEANECPYTGAIAVWCAATCGGPPQELVSYAGLIVPSDYEPPVGEGHPTIHQVDAGRYARATHMGSYEGLHDAWQTFMNEAIPQAGLEMADGDTFEQYMNDCAKVPLDEVQTDLFAPIRG